MLNTLAKLHSAAEAGAGISLNENRDRINTLKSQRERLTQQLGSGSGTSDDTAVMRLLDRTIELYSNVQNALQREQEWKQIGYRGGHYATVKPDMVQAQLDWTFADSTFKKLHSILQGRSQSFVCPVCGGTKSLTCPLCKGSGECFDSDACKGTGRIPCFACKGTGRDETKSPGGTVTSKPCIPCAAKGTLPCPGCLGSGRCRLCNGHKTMPCSACAD